MLKNQFVQLDKLFNCLENEKEKKFLIYLEIAKIYISNFLYDDALKYLFDALNENECKGKEYIFFEIGKIYFFKNNFQKSIEYLNNSLKIINSTSDIYVHISFLLFKAYKNIKDYEKSSHIIYVLNQSHVFTEEEKKLYKHELNEYVRYPGQYDFDGDYNKLINIYLEVLKGNPYDKQVLCFLAQTYNYLGMYNKTIDLYKNNNEKVKDNKFFNNKFLNEYEIASKKTIIESKPRNLMVVLSNKCNLACIMCRAIQNTWQLPEDKLEEIRSLFPYLERVLWQGGEVLLLPYFKELLKESLKYPNIKQAILTNFQLADEEIINLIVENNIELRISIDGVDKLTYEKIRRGGSFQKLIDNINLLNVVRNKVDTQMSLNLSIVVMRENYNKLIDFVEFAHKYNFNLITFNKIEYSVNEKSTEKEKKFALEQDIFTYNNDEELKCLAFQVNLVKEKVKEYKIQTEFRFDTIELTEDDIKFFEKKENIIKIEQIDNIQECNIVEDKVEKENLEEEKIIENKYDETFQFVNNNCIQEKLLCHLPWNTLTFYYDGSVRPDCLCDMNKIIGHLKNSTIKELWNNSKMQLYRTMVSTNNTCNWCSKNCTNGRVVDSYLKLL